MLEQQRQAYAVEGVSGDAEIASKKRKAPSGDGKVHNSDRLCSTICNIQMVPTTAVD
jgi:hypothetical protein